MYEIIYLLAKRLIVVVPFTCFSFLSYSQQNSIDSLLSIANSKSGVDKFDPLIDVVRAYVGVDYAKAISTVEEAQKVALEFGDSLRIVKAYRIKGQLLNRIDKPNEAIEALSLAMPIALRNSYRDEYKVVLNNLAIAHSILAEYDRALDIHFQTLVLREEDGDKAETSISLNNIGFVYFKLKNYEKAIEYFQRSLQLKKEVSDDYDLDRLLINIGLSFVHLHDYSRASDYFNQAFKACGGNCDSQIVIEGEFGLGVANYGSDDLQSAKKNFEKSLEVAIKSNQKRFQAENYVYLGRVAIKTDDTDLALKFLRNAETISIESNYNQLLIDTYREFSNLYNLLNDFQRASIYQNKYIALKDSLIGEELVKNIARIQTSFEERENIATIAAKEEMLTRQRMLNVAVAIIALLASLLIFVLYRNNIVTRRVNSALSKAKTELQELNEDLDKKVKEKTASLRQVNEELDNFIYKTSHDIRGPLASLKGICNLALMEVKEPVALDYLTKLDDTADKLNKILTRLLIINQINNANLGAEPIDLEAMVNEIIQVEAKRGLPSRFSIRKEIAPGISFHSDKELVRIVLDNLIDNAIKFYNDSERVDPFVHIRMAMLDRQLSIQVIDNGVGITQVHPDKLFQMFSRASERSGTGGIGLYLSKLATEKLGGTIGLRTTPEGYTEFHVALPMREPVVAQV